MILAIFQFFCNFKCKATTLSHVHVFGEEGVMEELHFVPYHWLNVLNFSRTNFLLFALY